MTLRRSSDKVHAVTRVHPRRVALESEPVSKCTSRTFALVLLFGWLPLMNVAAAQDGEPGGGDSPRTVLTTPPQTYSEPRLGDLTRTMKPHVVRVRVFMQFEFRRVDGVLYDRRRFDFGICGGLVVSDDPLVMVSWSACPVDRPPVAPSPTSVTLDSNERRYEFVLADGSVLAAEVVRKETELNFILLRPSDPSRWPADLTRVESLGPRPAPGEHIGVVAFRNAAESDQLQVIEESIQPVSAGYARPALIRCSVGLAGLPVCDVDGRLVGIVNLPPPSEPFPRATLNVPARDPPPGRDPFEWSFGVRKPLLIPTEKLAPLLEELARAPRPVAFGPLGMSLAERGGQVVILAVVADSAAARAGLVSGDVLLRAGGESLAGVDGFSAILERALGADSKSLTLAIVRGSDSRTVELSLLP